MAWAHHKTSTWTRHLWITSSFKKMRSFALCDKFFWNSVLRLLRQGDTWKTNATNSCIIATFEALFGWHRLSIHIAERPCEISYRASLNSLAVGKVSGRQEDAMKITESVLQFFLGLSWVDIFTGPQHSKPVNCSSPHLWFYWILKAGV